MEAEGLWLMSEASQHERSVGAMALGGSLLEGSRPGGEEGTAPTPGFPQILTFGGSGRGWHPWPSLLHSEGWPGF